MIKLYVVDEFPSKSEHGYSRQLLTKTFLNNGVREDEYEVVTLVDKVSPAGNFSPYYASFEGRELLDNYVRILREKIREVKPNLVLCLGGEPFKALTGKSMVSKWRGSVLWNEDLGVKVLSTVNPSMVLRQYDFFPLFSADLKKAKKEMQSPTHSRLERELVIAPSFSTTMKELDRLEEVDKFAFDIESFSIPEEHSTYINAIAFSDRKDWALCIPFSREGGESFWVMSEEMEVWRKIAHLMKSEVKKVAQNAQFDMGVLEGIYGIRVENLFLDTMCAHHILYPELPKGLDVLCSLYTDQPYYKYLRKTGVDTIFWQYNALDACVTYEVGELQLEELKVEGLWEFYNKFIHPLIRVLLDVQIRGVKINEPLREKVKVEIKKKMIILQAKFDEAIGHPINVNSPKQLKELFYDDMGLPPRYKRGTHRLTTDEDALRQLEVKHPSPLFDFVLGLRQLHKTYSTYLDVPLRGGRTHTSYNIGGRISKEGIISGPETGRLSSSESIIFCSGSNFQNIPHGNTRRIFVPDEGYTLVGMDGSQAEARVVAHLAEEPRLIKVFEDNKDVHLMNASWIYEKEEKDVTKSERTFAKKHVHAFNYGEGVGQFSKRSGLSYTRAREILNKYFDTFPYIRIWHQLIQRQLDRTRLLITPFGRKRVFYGRWGEDMFREGYAYIPQSTVGDFTNLGIVGMERDIKEQNLDAQCLLQIHDGVVWQVRKEIVDTFITALKLAFHIMIAFPRSTLVIPIEISVGENWEDMEVVK